MKFVSDLKFWGWLTVALLCVPSLKAENFFKNPAYENKAEGWIIKCPEGTVFEVEPTAGPDASPALHFNIANPLPDKALVGIHQVLSMRKNALYTFKAKIKSNISGLKVNIGVRSGVKPWPYVFKVRTFDISSDWTEVVYEILLTEDFDKALVEIRFPAKAGEFWVGPMELTSLTAAAAPAITKDENQNAKPATKMMNLPAGADHGKIKAYDKVKKQIVLSSLETNNDAIYSISPRTKVIIENVPGKMEDILVGHEVVVIPAADPLFADEIRIIKKP